MGPGVKPSRKHKVELETSFAIDIGSHWNDSVANESCSFIWLFINSGPKVQLELVASTHQKHETALVILLESLKTGLTRDTVRLSAPRWL